MKRVNPVNQSSDSEFRRPYESRLDRPDRLKLPEFKRNERLKHVLMAGQFDRELIEYLCNLADALRTLHRTKEGADFLGSLLTHKRAMLYFTQASTRTYLSFVAACQILGLRWAEVRDPQVSSEAKGESPFDSIRMFSSYFDLIIMRTREPRLAECCSYMMNDLEAESRRHVPVVNAGSGADEHPTQALLDIYTIRRAFEFRKTTDSADRNRLSELRRKHPGLKRGIDGKTYGFVGDLARGRTVRSLVQLLALHEHVRFVFVSADHALLRMNREALAALTEAGAQVREVESFESPIDGRPAIEGLDALYVTRIQREHDKPGESDPYAGVELDQYRLSLDLVQRLPEHAIVLHPFPRDSRANELPPEVDGDSRAYYFRQARNGMWIRAALIAYLFDVDARIMTRMQRELTGRHDYNESVL
jgi:aspartate carbamoyltransferase